MSSMPPRWYRSLLAPCLIVGCAFAVQLTHLAGGKDDPTFHVPIIDAAVYHDAAIRFAQGGRLSDDAYWQPPLFPLLLGILYRAVGDTILAARAMLALMAVGSCLLVWRIGSTVFSPRVGIAAALMLAFYGPFVFFATQLLPVGLAVFLILLAMTLWLQCLQEPRWPRWAGFGVITGLATITVPNAAVVVLLACAGIGASLRRRKPREKVWWAAVFLLGAGIPVGAITARNYAVAGEWVLISTNGGINFYVGNNPQSDRSVAIRPGEPWQRFAREACEAGARTLPEQNRYFFRRALAYAAENPFAFARGLARKLVFLINAREIPRNVDPCVHREYSTLLSGLLWRAGPVGIPFGLLFPMAAAGIVLWLGSTGPETCHRRAGWLFLSFAAAYGASVVLFFVTARYRLPIIPMLTLFAAYALVSVWDDLRTRPAGLRDLRPRTWALVTFITAGAVSNWPISIPTDQINFRAELAMSVGSAHLQQGDLQAAQRFLRRALELEPDYPAALARLSGVHLRLGRPQRAEQLASSVDLQAADSIELWVALGAALTAQERFEDARAAFQRALALDASSPEANAALAELFADMNEWDLAIHYYRAALQCIEKPGPVLLGLADALVANAQALTADVLERNANAPPGESIPPQPAAQRADLENLYAEAIDYYRRALWQIEPDDATLNRVAWLLATCPVPKLRDCRRAIELAEHLCDRTAYQNAVALDTLAAAYAECGRLAEAVTWAQKALEIAVAVNRHDAADAIRPRLELYRQLQTNR